MLPWDSVLALSGRLNPSALSCDTISGSGLTIFVATNVISLISSDLSTEPEVEPVDDFLSRLRRNDGDNGDGLGEQESPRSTAAAPPLDSQLPLGHLVSDAVCISASPLIFKLSAVWKLGEKIGFFS